jgi:hypothetical protein
MSSTSVNSVQPGTPILQDQLLQEVKKRDWAFITYVVLAALSMIVFIAIPILMSKGYLGGGEWGNSQALYGLLAMLGSAISAIGFTWAAVNRP